MPRVVGYVGEEVHDKLVAEIVEIEDFYRSQLSPWFKEIVGRWRLYLADREDTRLKHEKWRAASFVPWPYVSVEAEVGQLAEIMNSVDPPIQAEGVGPEDTDPARKMEAMHAYALQKNNWLYQQDVQYRELMIAGTAVWKPVWANKVRPVRVHPSPDDVMAFQRAIEQAVKMGAPPPPDDPDAFTRWRDDVNLARAFGAVPEPPLAGEQEIIQYRGPWLERPSLFDLRFDPMVEDVQDQPIFIHRIVKPKRWLLARTGEEAGKPFDPRQVTEALEKHEGGRFSEWEDQIAQMLGIPRVQHDPLHEDAIELLECWRPNTPATYCVLLNRTAVINKTPDVHPYWHVQTPFVFVKNIALPRRALGISPLQITKRLALHINTFHDLALDATLLSVIPFFIKKRGAGIPDRQLHIRPGGFIDAETADAIQTLSKYDPSIQGALQAIDRLQGIIDETHGTQPQVRGAQALVGRVSASEFQGRLNQALVRSKQKAIRIEAEHQPLPVQMSFLWYQFGDEKVKARIGGNDARKNPFVEMSRADFLEVLGIDFKFRGATRSLNRELLAQQLDGLLRTATQAQAVVPAEARLILKKIAEIQGHKGLDAMFTDEGTADLMATWKLQMMNVRMQLAAAQKQIQQQQLGIPPGAVPGQAPPPNGAAEEPAA